MKSDCEGCQMYDREKDSCNLYIIPHITKTDQCPCMTCLIKGICNNICENYIEYRNMTNRHIEELKRERDEIKRPV